MKYQTPFIVERIEQHLQTFQRQCKPGSREYHYYFALAIALALHDIPDETTLDSLITAFIQHTPYPEEVKK